jgi:membrane protein DedA with SNARE-associated domain
MIALDVLRVDSLLSYLIAILAPALDAILPVIPSETAVITLGVATAGSADPRIALLVLCSAAGAFVGDNLCYLLGRRFGPWIERRFFRSEKGQQRRDWAERSLERYGMPLIIVCRFIPGGRTAVMLCCGIVGYQRRRFVIATAAAGLIWASYSFFIGRLGGRAFEDKPWAGLLLALGLTLAVSTIIEAIRRIRSRRGRGGRGGRGARSGRSGRDGQNGQNGQNGPDGPDGPDGQNGRPAQSQTADTARERPYAVAESPADTPKRPDPASERHHEPTGPRIAPNSEISGSR